MKMMKILLNKYALIFLGLIFSLSVFAQMDTTMVMDPGTFELDPGGYYVAGVDKQLDDCGPNTLHFGGCDDAYGDSDHDESGTQFGWQYGEAIIFHDCAGPETNQVQTCVASADKYHTNHPEGWDTTEDFLRLGKHKYFGTDSAHYGYIISPPFSNLKSLTIKSTSDISRQEGSREIVILIEASYDGGETWEFIDNLSGVAYVQHIVLQQAGDIASYTDGGGDGGFQEIVDGSKSADSTMLRILPIPYIENIDRHPDGQRLNIWEVTIEAQTVVLEEEPEEVLSAGKSLEDFPFIIRNDEFISRKAESLYIYNLSGILVGKGKSVPIPCKGLYVIRTPNGFSEKIYIK